MSNISAWVKNDKIVTEAKVVAEQTVGAVTNHSVATYDYYEDASILESYDKFHFGPGLLAHENFLVAMGKVCLNMA